AEVEKANSLQARYLRERGDVRLRVLSSSGELVEKEIHRGNPAVPGNDEVGPRVLWRFTGAARYPLDPPAIAQFLWRDNGLIPKVGVSRLDHASDPMDFVAAMVGASGLVEHAIFGEDFIDCCPSTDGVVFTEDVFKIADEQGRYTAHWFSSEVPSSTLKFLTCSCSLPCAPLKRGPV